jgi:O-antigen/teichoic acid export membrane protein
MKMFETVFTEYYQPIFYRDIAFTDTHQKAQAWNRYISAYFPSIILMGSFIGFGGPFLARLLVSESFHQVSWLSLWGVLTQLALMVYAAYVSFSFALLDTRRLMISNFFGALVAIGGTLLLAPWQPLLGTAIALFLAMFVTMLITAFNLGIDFPLRLPWRRLGKAGALALPLMLMMELLSRIFLDPTVLQSFMSLTITGIYMLFAQFILAREWIFSKSSIVKTQN